MTIESGVNSLEERGDDNVSNIPDWVKNSPEWKKEMDTAKEKASPKPKVIGPQPPQPKKRALDRLQTSEQDKSQIESLRAQLEAGIPEDVEKREKLVNKVLQEASIGVNFWLNSEISKKRYLGYQVEYVNNKNKKSNLQYFNLYEPSAQLGLDRKSNDLLNNRDILRDHNINEFIDIRTTKGTTTEIKEVVIPGKKGNWFGFGKTPDTTELRLVESGYRELKHKEIVANNGQDEQAITFGYVLANKDDYTDTNKRRGVSLRVEIVLPKSTALEFESELRKDPRIIRDIIERAVVEKIFLDPRDPNSGLKKWREPKRSKGRVQDDVGSPVRPDWEKWDMEPNGGRVYIQKEGGEPGWHEENVYQIKK